MRRLFIAATFIFLTSPVFTQEQPTTLPGNHWAYEAMNGLQQHGILIGYPHGAFSGGKLLSRNDFTEALVKVIPVMTSLLHDNTTGESNQEIEDAQLPRFVRIKDAFNYRCLIGEFHAELTDKGVDVFAQRKAAMKLLEQVVEWEKQAVSLQFPEIDEDSLGNIENRIIHDYSSPRTRPKNVPVPKEHWVYYMMHRLQKESLLAGYPDDAFTGKQIFTNYGFSAALFRVIPFITKEVFTDPRLCQSTQPIRPMEEWTAAGIEAVRRLVDEFRDELSVSGVNIDALKREVARINDRVHSGEREIFRSQDP